MIVRWSVLLASCLIFVVTSAAPSGDVTITTPQDVTPTPKPQVKDDEEVANVEQVPPPAPLITESAQQGYRMSGMYALGSQPFYLERDPVTGAVDFSHPSQGDETHRYSSKVSQPSGGSSLHEDDYDETALVDDFESDPIDRKDTFVGSDRPNDLKPYRPEYQNIREKNKEDKFPLISNSYANTKVQGMGLTKPAPTKSTPSNPPPSYYSPNPKTTTESILDFWPQKGASTTTTTTTTTTPPPPDMYEYYEGEEPTAEQELEEEYQTTKIPATTKFPAVITSKPYASSTPNNEELSTVVPSQKPVTFSSRPYGYEEPFRPIYGPGEGEEKPSVKWPEPVERPLPPSIYNLPPRFDQQQPPRPVEDNNNNRPDDYEPSSIFSPPPPPVPIYNQQPGQRRPPPSIVPQPPVYEPTRYRPDEEDRDEAYTLKPVQIDSQGWKQATYTQQTSPQPTPTTRGPFSEGPAEETFTTLPYPSSPNTFRQPLPQGYEPKRPYPPQFRPPQQRPRPGDVRRPDDRPNNFENQRPNFENQRPNFENQRPNFERPNRLPIDGRPPFPPGQNRRHNQPPPLRRWENRPQFNGPPPPPGMYKNGPPPKSNEQGLPNILPQFRPNANGEKSPNFRPPPPPNVHGGDSSPNFRPPPPANLQSGGGDSPANFRPPPPNRRQSSAGSGYIMYPPNVPSPPPSPPVGRRVGSQVSTLQMMQHGSLPRLSARDDAPHPNPRPPKTPPKSPSAPFEVRPSKYGPNPQSSEERPVFVVYANSGENQESSDVLVGTHGLHKPLPPSHLSAEQEEPVLGTKPPRQPLPPVRTEFPYALEKPSDTEKYPTKEQQHSDEEINVIPNLQDYIPFAIKSTSKTQTTYAPPSTQSEITTPVRSTVSIIRPQTDNNEFTVSAVMHTGHPIVGTGSVMVVAPQQHRINPVDVDPTPQHRNPVQTSSAPALTHESFNFQAPFHPSANVQPSPGNGWSAVKGSQQQQSNNEALLRPGTVDRADVHQEEIIPPTTNNKFDIENFKPELQGGFKPIYSIPESGEDTEKNKPSTEREEKKF